MQIKPIKAHRVLQPFVSGIYTMSKGRQANAFDAMIVAINADSALTGWGKMAPLGSFYSAAFAVGVRAGVIEIAPHLIGEDPRALTRIGRLMDMACCDHAARNGCDDAGTTNKRYRRALRSGDPWYARCHDRQCCKINYRRMQAQLRDLAVDLGFMVTVEDTGGAEMDTAAMAHLSLSTPAQNRLNAIAFHPWVTVRTASNVPPVTASDMGIPDGPGLGIDVRPDLLGAPFFEMSA